MLKVFAQPTLRSPALLCGFSGWADAASAASGALRYLLLKKANQKIAEFEPDEIFVYTTNRPLNLFDELGNRKLQWPELAIYAIEAPEVPKDLVIVLGSEPDLKWRRCVVEISQIASRLGVSQIITLGAYMAQVHYAGTPIIHGNSNDPRIQAKISQLGIGQSGYQGPTSFVTAIMRNAFDLGIPSVSLWVAAPNYLSNTTNPKLAAALLKVAEQLLGQRLWIQELEAAGRDMERRIGEALRARPDLEAWLRQLSGEADVQPADLQPIPQTEEQEPDLPSAEEVLRDLEEHLRRIKGNDDRDEGSMEP